MGCCGTKEAPKGAIAAKPQKAVKAEDDKKYAVKNNRGEAAIPLDTIGTSDDVTVVYFPDDQAASPFNELDASAAVSKDGSLARILETIGDCEWKMELCVPSLTNPNLVVVLNAMSENGMRIRIITDDKFPTPPELSSAVQHQVFKKPNTPFEHSFAVLDDSSVLSGTYDWTEVSALTTHAACVSTKSRKVAARYVTEFDRLWEETGPNAESFNNNARSAVSRFDKKSNIFFFPDWGSSGNHDTASAILIKSMKKAKKSVKLALPNLLLDDFHAALTSLPVPVSVLTQQPCEPLAGLTVYTLENCRHAFLLIDDTELVTGSFDWTMKSSTGALQNCVYYTSGPVVESFAKEFKDLCNKGTLLQ